MLDWMMRHIEIAFAGILILLIAALIMTVLGFRAVNGRKGGLEKEIQEKKERKREKICEARKVAAPDGINPNPLSYTVIHDAGHDIYVRSFTVDSLPKRTVFASTFPALFNFDRAVSSVFIEPIGEGRASHLLDGRIVEIEMRTATRSGS